MSAPAVIDRSKFCKTRNLVALRIPKQKTQDFMKKFRGYTLEGPRLRCVTADQTDATRRLLLLDEKILSGGVSKLPEELLQMMAEEGAELVDFQLKLDYTNLSSDAALQELLPEGVEAPSGFETVGHIAHFNLREEHLPYKHLIGQVILDKNPSIRTVVNKVGRIENEFRVFQMELIAGEADLQARVSQHGSLFDLDFSKVYWNSRLETEHKRLVDTFRPGQVVADIMAGVGPFAIPAGRKGCTVLANDLNPDSVRWLTKNIALNKVAAQVQPFCMDGRAFVRLLCDTPLPPQQPENAPEDAAAGTCGDLQRSCDGDGRPAEPSTASAGAETPPRDVADAPPPVPHGFRQGEAGTVFHHAVMNLPASAIEFLDVFAGAFDPKTWRGRLPLVHCYTFATEDEPSADIVRRAEGYLGGPLDSTSVSLHRVRDVAPRKRMFCISFRVPEAIAFHGSERQLPQQPEGATAATSAEESSSKRRKCTS